MGSNGIAKYLENQGIEKKVRQNGNKTIFSANLVRTILENPVYCGKIAYGRRKNEKVNGSTNEYKVVKQSDYMLYDGVHEAIVDIDLWEKAQVKRKAQAKKYERTGKNNEKVHLLSGILKCPICGAGMYGNKSIKKTKDNSGENNKEYWYYRCKHRKLVNGHKCEFKNQLDEANLDKTIIKIISKKVSNHKIADSIQKKINEKVDTSKIDEETKNYKKKLSQLSSSKKTIQRQMDLLDVDEKQYERKFSDLNKRMDEKYSKIDEIEELLKINNEKKSSIEAEKMTAENIYKILIFFDKLYDKMSDDDKRNLISTIVSEIQIYEKEQSEGQWLKLIKFKNPLIKEELEVSEISLDNNLHV